jgi:transposase
VSGYSAAWVRALIRRYNARGASAIGDQRQHNQGGQRLLNAEQEADLRAEIEGGISAGEIWTGVDVARRISELVGYAVHRARGWELLKRWGLKQRTPRPRHAKADVSMQEVFKKNTA